MAEMVEKSRAPEKLGVERIEFGATLAELDDAIESLTNPEQIVRDRCIYIITLDRDVDLSAFKEAFFEAQSRDNLKLPQDNHDIGPVLYVGSSYATGARKRTLRSRLRQHLIKAPKGTYALSLSEWTSHLSGAFFVQAWQFPSRGDGPEGDDVARNTVLAVEDWLSGELKPMLGRRGSRR
ncbi:hypothetical protein E3U23_01595 [Erythrobacter litoralis]|uniref:hypothetical protein n=1 Tax=Erythrobacter litoralis TaxID=39960 RepID=UPI0024350FA0|nr:hypothetical protein [Erythrobacter litoralis]MDG6077892.1 hypothetical protein [Erythrobacter litoralis]